MRVTHAGRWTERGTEKVRLSKDRQWLWSVVLRHVMS